MKAKIITFILIIGIILLMMSCSARWHLKQAKKHETLAVAKGGVIANDTVYKDIIREVPVPGSSGNADTHLEVDTTKFKATMSENDSLVLVVADLQRELASGNTLDQERTMAKLAKAQADKRRLEEEIQKRFLADSTYRYKVDSITIVSVMVQDGQIANVGYVRDDVVVEVKDTIPIEIKKIFNAGYSKSELAVAGVGGLLLVLAIGFLIGYIQGRDKK